MRLTTEVKINKIEGSCLFFFPPIFLPLPHICLCAILGLSFLDRFTAIVGHMGPLEDPLDCVVVCACVCACVCVCVCAWLCVCVCLYLCNQLYLFVWFANTIKENTINTHPPLDHRGLCFQWALTVFYIGGTN